jgi:tRNA threonylcarbamoyladenosine modification (KEOPS) complex  Pcc1 subunit
MNFEATISTDFDENIIKVFAPENKHSKNSRSKYSVIKKDDLIIFNIKAKDAVALRATLNTITRLLSIFEKMRGIPNGPTKKRTGKNSKTSTI